MAAHLHLNASSFSTLPWRALHLNLSPFLPSTTPEGLIKLAPISKPFPLGSSSQLSLSLQDQVVNGVQVDDKRPGFAEPHGNSASSPSSELWNRPQSKSKSRIWINPNSPTAHGLRMKSCDVRYPDLVSTAKELNSCNPALEDVSIVLDRLGGDMIERDAVTVLNKISNPETALVALEYFLKNLKPVRQVVLYNVTLEALGKRRDLQRAEKVFNEMLQRGVNPDNVTFSTLITCARHCSLPEKAVIWFDRMTEFGCEPDAATYSAVIDVFGQIGGAHKAVSLYERSRTERRRLDVVAFFTLIRIYGKSGNFDGCLNVYEQMKDLQVRPNHVIYNSLLDCMGRAKRPWKVKNIFKDMTDSGISPTWGTYAALLRAFSKARYGDDALKVYREMKEKGYELNVVPYNAMLAMCADIGYDDEAAEIFQDMKNSGTCEPDSWTFSSMVTLYACSGQVEGAESVLDEMLHAGFQPNIFVLTSLIQCYGKANRTNDVVRTFNQIFEFAISPDDRFCGSLLNVMTQTPKEEVGKLIDCVEKANEKLGSLVKLLVEDSDAAAFREASMQLFEAIAPDVKKAYCNCLIDLSINFNLLEKACELLDMGLILGIYDNMQSRTQTQWSLNLKTLSHGAALTALHIWMNDLTRSLENGEDLPPVLGINTGHGKHRYSEKGLAGVVKSHLMNLNSPFHEAADEPGWFLTTKSAAKAWLELRNAEEVMSV